MIAPAPPSDIVDTLSHSRWAGFWLALIVLLSALPGAINLPVLDRDEARYAQASNQMVETGDLVEIRLQDEARNKKPIGIYWAQAASIALFSDTDARQILVNRLPSLLAGVLAAWACFWGGSSLVGRRAAFLGASLFAASLMLTTEAQIAKTDAALVASITFAMAAAARLQAGSAHSLRLALTFWASLALSVLIKGPVGPMVVLPAILAFIVCTRHADNTVRKGLLALRDWRGPVLFAAMVLPWFIAIAITTQGQFFVDAIGKDVSDKLSAGGEHTGTPPGLHLLLLPILIFPVTLALIPAIGSGIAAWKQEGAARRALIFLLCWIVPGWIVFEITPVKLIHYTLPLHPAIALMAGAGLVWLTDRDRRAPVSALLLVCVGALWALMLTPEVMGLLAADAAERFGESGAQIAAGWQGSGLSGPIWGGPLLAISVFGLSLGAGVCLLLKRVGMAWALALIAGLIVGAGLRGLVLPAQGWAQPSSHAAALLGMVCQPEGTGPVCADHGPVSVYGFNEPSLVFLLGTHTTLNQSAETAGGIGAFVFNTQTDIGQTALARLDVWLADQPDPLCVRRKQSDPLINPANGKPVQWQAVAVSQGRCLKDNLAK
jgi:4-amino-4-deoxy-L-arabinose transferase-like glycosyltransferase